MNNIEIVPATAGPKFRPRAIVATILALTLEGANSEARVTTRVKIAAVNAAGRAVSRLHRVIVRGWQSHDPNARIPPEENM